jgi:hypothetical protein
MPADKNTVPPAEALSLATLVTPTEHGIASRVLAKTTGGNVTLSRRPRRLACCS